MSQREPSYVPVAVLGPALLVMALGVPVAPASAQDVVRVDSVSASAGELVTIPLRVRDRPNTPLNSGGGPDQTIRGVSVTVEYSPATAVEAVEIVRAGLTSGLATRFEAQVPGASRHSWLAAFDEDIPFSGGAQTVAQLRVLLAEGAPEGPVELHLVPESTALSNGSGTLVETVGNGLLQLADGTVDVTSSCTTAATLCLLDERFLVEVEWTDFNGATGAGNAVQLTTDAGYFWFFNDDNVEAVIKVLDGRGVNGHFWVFYGALSNVEYRITVTDSATGAAKTYFNPSGRFASVGDIEAFAGGAAAAPGPEHPRPRQVAVGKQGGCSADGNSLCLLDGRFRLEMTWEDFVGGTGAGNAVQLTDDAGYFWFFDRDNVELVVKTLDGRGVNGHFWVFYGALSNVEFTLKVTDTETGAVQEFFNPLGTFASVGDTAAF